MDRLTAAVAKDRSDGLLPAIVVGNAGTVNTGAIDPLDELADFCRRESLWFHVDGAYGAMARLSPRLAPLFSGIERADSVAADPHKWLYVPYEAGATLVREPGRLGAAFRKFPEYLAADAESPFPGPAWFAERGVELSRGFKALKVWMGLKVHGRRAYADAIENDVRLARGLAEEVDRRPDFERLAESVLSIANFRYRPAGRALPDAALDRINRRIINRLVGNGSFFLAPTVLKGRTALRVAIVNFRTTRSGPDGAARRGGTDRTGARGGRAGAGRESRDPSVNKRGVSGGRAALARTRILPRPSAAAAADPRRVLPNAPHEVLRRD